MAEEVPHEEDLVEEVDYEAQRLAWRKYKRDE